MASPKEIRDTLHSEFTTVVEDEFGLSSDHVRVANKKVDGPFPAITYSVFDAPVEHGFDGDIHTHSVSYTDGEISSITFRRHKRATVDIAAHASHTDVSTVDELYGVIEDTLIQYTDAVGDSSDFHEDVVEINLLGTQDVSQPSDAVHGERLRVELEYHTFAVIDDIDVMRNISITIDPDMDTEVSEEDITIDGNISVDFTE